VTTIPDLVQQANNMLNAGAKKKTTFITIPHAAPNCVTLWLCYGGLIGHQAVDHEALTPSNHYMHRQCSLDSTLWLAGVESVFCRPENLMTSLSG
jgi:hypothetical protein